MQLFSFGTSNSLFHCPLTSIISIKKVDIDLIVYVGFLCYGLLSFLKKRCFIHDLNIPHISSCKEVDYAEICFRYLREHLVGSFFHESLLSFIGPQP